ncbi:uncharacterized protein BX663DRAFT_565027 [Cokeromyces recurvatus]|uniref:uncharacterized protein n=1 Tax=Cokeromyces recurvatus TaxID=90255 RepID=UPI0022207934|nr:uncharacterized protein BX663DRAFT_565027 [Cokeromyces recurvatus]KAI7898102.1 hypothetical protein BX663DRAFT_565027 [Cokeromyces recurvatus]
MNLFNSKKEKCREYDNEDEEEESFVETFPHIFDRNDILICATHGKIYAIHKRDGSRLWRAKFPTGGLGGIVSLFVTDTDRLIVGSRGRTASMDLMTGKTLWVNKMPGFGIDEVSIISTPNLLSPNLLPPYQKEETEESYPDYDMLTNIKPIVFGCARGKVMAIDSETGETLWTYNCVGGWYNIPVIIVEPPLRNQDFLVYVGSGKNVYCLKASTGEVIWNVRVSNSNFGLNYMTLATPWSSKLAAETHSAFSQNPSAQKRDHQRDKEKSS